MIKTSVIIPVYNTAEYLKECFVSIFDQTQDEIEVIAINDGSTDNSLEILKEIQKEHPDMIIFSQENKGLGDARNRGLELASGEFIYFMDSDDCLKRTALESCYRYAVQNQLDMVMFDAETFGDMKYEVESYNRSSIITDQENVLTGEKFAYKYWLRKFSPSAWLIYTSAAFIKTHDLKFMPRVYYEDNEFYCRMMLLAERVMYIPKSLYRRRYREASIMTSPFDVRHANDFLKMIQAVDHIHCSKKVETVMRKLKIRFMSSLLNQCQNSSDHILEDPCFTKRLYKTVWKVFDRNIEEIDSYYEISVFCQLMEALPFYIVPDEIMDKAKDRKKEKVKILFSEIPLLSENKMVGIYGTGKNTQRFLYEYQENIGTLKAEIIFIDSNIVTGKQRYRNYPIFNIDDIGDMSLDCIVIASSKYEQEIYQTISEKYGDRFKCIRLSTDLGF